MLKALIQRIFKGKATPSEVEAQKLAQHKDPLVRAQLAARTDITPELLYFLAEDESEAVRIQIATNQATPPQANLLLATDDDETVRGELAVKIAHLAPGLTANEQNKVNKLTYETLKILAQDQIPKVRQILAETLKDVVNAPPDVIGRLARDADIAVASPILCYSPVLTDEDLLEIIQASPIPGAVAAISSRHNISYQISDLIASTDDITAIGVLLGNQSAQIREETLDRLVDRAVDVDEWHDPLVHRPVLSAKSTQKLARFVATHLLQALSEREDLDAETTQIVASIVRLRLDEMNATGLEKSEAHKAADEAVAIERAKKLAADGQLDESAVDAALTGGDFALVLACLALMSGMRIEVIRKTITNQSAKGIVSIVWKAGLTMSLALEIQTKLLHLPATRVLRPGVGGFPLSPAEMLWQLEFIDGEDVG